jgi:hypothetical protein
MTDYRYRKDYSAGDRKCIFCGAGPDRLNPLNLRGEFRGGVENFYYRCAECKQYFTEYWISGELKTVLGA